MSEHRHRNHRILPQQRPVISNLFVFIFLCSLIISIFTIWLCRYSSNQTALPIEELSRFTNIAMYYHTIQLSRLLNFNSRECSVLLPLTLYFPTLLWHNLIWLETYGTILQENYVDVNEWPVNQRHFGMCANLPCLSWQLRTNINA